MTRTSRSASRIARPAFGVAPELVAHYDANRLTVTRQLPFDPDSNKTLDLCLFVNGIPVATAELKNHLTGQNIEHAIKQYRNDRDPKNVTLGRRALVHFAVDPDAVAMTTKLEGKATRFLPFNLGHDLGKGNPPNPDGHKTSYLWERVWAKDAWLDILHRFIHVERPEKGSVSARRAAEKVIFPRYHQWDAVKKLEADAAANGAGHSYLIQHSAGSGKSNTIAWTAHRLSTLHSAEDRKVFDKVIVITDRVILDRQLQDTIYQFEHARGVVEKIDEDSSQLAEALEGEQARIIITTLQKFPFVIEKIGDVPARNYAVVIDEAHSSQTGEAAKDLRLRSGRRRGTGAHRGRGRGRRADRSGDRPGRGGPRALRRRAQRPPVEPLLLRVHRDPEGTNARDVRAPEPPDREARTVPPVLDAPGDRGGLHHGRARQLHDLPDLLEDREGDRGRPRVRRQEGKAGDRAVREPAPAPSRPEGGDHRRALPRAHRQGDGRACQGDGRDLLAPARRPLQAEHRQVHRREGLQRHQDAGRVLRQDRRRHRAAADREQHERLPRAPHRRGVRRRRLRRPDRRREVPDRIRPAAAAHDVRRQAARSGSRRCRRSRA